MDHREQMQKDAEQWQNTSVKLIQRLRYGIAAVALVGLLILFVQNLGVPEQVSETIPATVMTADGQTLDVSLTLRGEVTNYPFKPEKMSGGDQITVCVSDKYQRILRLIPYSSDNLFYGRTNNAVCVLNSEMDHLLLETDLQLLFPDMESKTCLVYFGNDSFDLPSEIARYFTLLQK